MPQFDVFLNPARTRANVPFVVSLQNRRFERLGTRFVAALVSTSVTRPPTDWPTPVFQVAGQEVFLDVSNMASVTAERLGNPIANLADEDSRAKLVRALDEFLSQA